MAKEAIRVVIAVSACIYQPPKVVQFLGAAGGHFYGAGVQEQEPLEESVVDGVEDGAAQPYHGQGGEPCVSRGISAMQTPVAQQDVADLADGVEGQQSFGLFLFKGLHGAGEEGDGAQYGNDHPHFPMGNCSCTPAGTSHRKQRITP